MKLVASLPRPFSLARLQVVSQSVSSEDSSALHLIKSLDVSSNSTIVTSYSNSTLYHWAVDMVAAFKGVFSLTHSIDLKKESE